MRLTVAVLVAILVAPSFPLGLADGTDLVVTVSPASAHPDEAKDLTFRVAWEGTDLHEVTVVAPEGFRLALVQDALTGGHVARWGTDQDGRDFVRFLRPPSAEAGAVDLPVSFEALPSGEGEHLFEVRATALSPGSGDESTVFVPFETDATPPTMGPVADLVAEATGAAGAVVTFAAPSAHDDVDGAVASTCTPTSGSTFALGAAPAASRVTVVTCRATDVAGNSNETSFTVTVRDTTAPVIDAKAEVVAEATSPTTTTVSYTPPTARDAVAGAFAASCAPASGTAFAQGPTTVTCNANDGRGNAATPTTFTVRVRDTTAPVVVVPTLGPIEANVTGGAHVLSYVVSATDSADASVTPVCSPPAPYLFPLQAAPTTVTCRATDDAGNEGEASFGVTVVDTTKPTVNVPSSTVVEEATGPAGATVSFSATVSDVADPAPSLVCSPASGGTFAIRTTTVTCTGRDGSSNEEVRSFDVLVEDTTPPTIALPAPVSLQAAGPTPVSFTATATDLVDGSVAPTCAPASGDTFPVGVTTVRCNASDSRGNAAAEGTFQVTLLDNAAPVMTAPTEVVAEATGADGALVTFAVTAIDAAEGARPVVCTPASGSRFALGSATVSCTSSDGGGRSSSATFVVRVRDTTAPAVADPGDAVLEATSAAGAVATFATPGWTDAVDGSGPAACDATSGATYPLGSRTVVCSATDAAGNSGSSTFTILVRDTTPPTIGPIADVSSTSRSVTLAATVTDNTQATVTWDLGDGTTVAGASVTHVYPGNGGYVARVTARDLAGLTATRDVAVNVQEPAPRTRSSSGSGASASVFAGADADADADPAPEEPAAEDPPADEAPAPGPEDEATPEPEVVPVGDDTPPDEPVGVSEPVVASAPAADDGSVSVTFPASAENPVRELALRAPEGSEDVRVRVGPPPADAPEDALVAFSLDAEDADGEPVPVRDAVVSFVVPPSRVPEGSSVALLHGEEYDPLPTRFTHEDAAGRHYEADAPHFSPFAAVLDARAPTVGPLAAADVPFPPGARVTVPVADDVGVVAVYGAVGDGDVPVDLRGGGASFTAPSEPGKYRVVLVAQDATGRQGRLAWDLVVADATDEDAPLAPASVSVGRPTVTPAFAQVTVRAGRLTVPGEIVVDDAFPERTLRVVDLEGKEVPARRDAGRVAIDVPGGGVYQLRYGPAPDGVEPGRSGEPAERDEGLGAATREDDARVPGPGALLVAAVALAAFARGRRR